MQATLASKTTEKWSWDVETSDTLTDKFALKKVPVGGEYTAHFKMGDKQTSVPHLLVGELWVVGGQSNALGGEVQQVPEAIPQVHILKGDTWQEGRDPLFAWFGAVHVSPWIIAGREYYKRTGIPVGMMGYCAPARDINYFMDVFHSEMTSFQEVVTKHGKAPQNKQALKAR